MAIRFGRRQFISALGGASLGWPLTARAQQPAMQVIGILHPGSPETSADFLTGFRNGLAERDYVEGQNVAIEYRWGHTRFDQLPALAADLVNRRVAILVVSGPPAVQAAKTATTAIPIVFAMGADPVALGLVASLNRPGSNVTGITSMNVELMPKRFGILLELVPAADHFAVLVNADSPNAEPLTGEVQAAAASTKRQIDVFSANSARQIDTAYASLLQRHANALLVSADPLFIDRRVQLASLAIRHALPTIYPNRQFTEVGGLMSYGTSGTELSRQVGIYAGRILKGDKPGDLPVMRATKFELVINQYTAVLLGIAVPQTLLAQADEVIE